MRGSESVYVTSPGKTSSVDAQEGQRCGRRILQRHPDLNPSLWLFHCLPMPELPTWDVFIGSGPWVGEGGRGSQWTLVSNSSCLHSAFQIYMSPFWSQSKIWLLKKVLFITTCQVEATAAFLTSNASNRSLNWVFLFIYLSIKQRRIHAISGK